MQLDQVNENSPLRILERCCQEGLGEGELGVVMARAGVGKTAFLVQIGLDHAHAQLIIILPGCSRVLRACFFV